ncbi:MAG: MerR family transcriptional regulator [Bacteroidales bacterium]|nr:MerR family transcriptional regulator [Bacteroidales bacterium]
MANYSIRDLERLTGIKAHTIRIWEKRYGLIDPERTSTNIRAYCDSDLKKLLNISILNKNGFKISKIARLSPFEIVDIINRLSEHSTDSESLIENLTLAMIDLDEYKFEKTLSKAIIQLGFENTVIRILNPFLFRIGIMWQTGSINSAQEHFVSNLLKQKMFVAIDGQIGDHFPDGKTFVLFLPEGEMHEMSLFFANYLIRKRGHKVIYLGQSVPLNDLVEISNICNPDYFLTSFITSMSDCDVFNYLISITKQFPEKIFFVTGNQASGLKNDFPGNAFFISSPQELILQLDSISTK